MYVEAVLNFILVYNVFLVNSSVQVIVVKNKPMREEGGRGWEGVSSLRKCGPHQSADIRVYHCAFL